MKKLALGLPGGSSIPDPTSFAGGELADIINAVVPYLFGFLGLIFIFVIIFGGFEFLTSGGNPEKVQAGKNKITYALAGLLIALAAYWIIQILQVVLGIRILG